MKIALVHDWLVGMRGGEKCLEAACDVFPDADVFTLIHRRGAVSPKIERRRIQTSFLQKFPGVHRYYRYLLPLFPLAVERFDFSEYDLILSLSHAAAKGAIPAPQAQHACYCFSPMRYVWDLYGDYFGRRGGFELTISAFTTALRVWDVAATARIDRIAAISHHVQRRISRYYRRESTVLYPPVEDEYFERLPASGRGEYFLVVSALAPYKRLDLAIEAVRRTGDPLWIVGTGPEETRLRRIAPPSVRFLGWQPAEKMPDLYAKARALVFPGIEDFGIAPLECQAMGRPVVGFQAGGLLETVEPLRESGNDSPTGVLFSPQTVEGVIDGLETFKTHEREFEPLRLRHNASRFRRDRFLSELRAFAYGGTSDPC